MGEGLGDTIDWEAVFNGLESSDEHVSVAAASGTAPSAIPLSNEEGSVWDNIFPSTIQTVTAFPTASTPIRPGGRPKPVHRSTYPYSAPIPPIQNQNQDDILRQLARSIFGHHQTGMAEQGSGPRQGQVQHGGMGGDRFGNVPLPLEGSSAAHQVLEARLRRVNRTFECKWFPGLPERGCTMNKRGQEE